MKIKFLSEQTDLPSRIDIGAAGFDVTTPKDVIIYPGRNLVKLGFSIELPANTVAFNRPKSGLSLKGMKGYAIGHNGIPNPEEQRFDADAIEGTIDESYRGECGTIIKSYERVPFLIKKGTPISQFVIVNYHAPDLEVVQELSSTYRGERGFGELDKTT